MKTMNCNYPFPLLCGISDWLIIFRLGFVINGVVKPTARYTISATPCIQCIHLQFSQTPFFTCDKVLCDDISHRLDFVIRHSREQRQTQNFSSDPACDFVRGCCTVCRLLCVGDHIGEHSFTELQCRWPAKLGTAGVMLCAPHRMRATYLV